MSAVIADRGPFRIESRSTPRSRWRMVTPIPHGEPFPFDAQGLRFDNLTDAVAAAKQMRRANDGTFRLTAPIAFGSWRCNCSMLTRTREEIPHRCPEHSQPLLGSISLAWSTKARKLGRRPPPKPPIDVTQGQRCNVMMGDREPRERLVTKTRWCVRNGALRFYWHWKPEPRPDGHRDIGYSGVMVEPADNSLEVL